MPMYVLNRTHTLRTTSGVVSFTKGVPTNVPQYLVRDAIAIGAEPADGERPEMLEPEFVDTTPIGDDRDEAIFETFKILVAKNESGDFTGQGVPTVKAVEREAKFDVERGEVNALWAKFKVVMAEAEGEQ